MIIIVSLTINGRVYFTLLKGVLNMIFRQKQPDFSNDFFVNDGGQLKKVKQLSILELSTLYTVILAQTRKDRQRFKSLMPSK